LVEKDISKVHVMPPWLSSVIGRILADFVALGLFVLGLDMFLSVFGLNGISYVHSFGLLIMFYGIRTLFVRGGNPSA
jgi:hypothetical protein